MDIEVIKARLADMYDPDALVDILEISVEDIVDAFEDRVRSRIDDLFYREEDAK